MTSGRPAVRVLAVAVTVATVAAACGDRGVDPDPDVVARGEQLYAASCVQCHGGPTGGQRRSQAEVTAAECTDQG